MADSAGSTVASRELVAASRLVPFARVVASCGVSLILCIFCRFLRGPSSSRLNSCCSNCAVYALAIGTSPRQLPSSDRPSACIHSTVQRMFFFLYVPQLTASTVADRHLLLMPMRCVLLFPAHSLWCSLDNNAAALQRSSQRLLTFLGSIQSLCSPNFWISLRILYDNAPFVSVSIGIVKLALNACKIVVIVVDAVWSSKIRAFDVKRRVADAVALRPLLVTFNAREGACASRTAGAAVFMGSDVACGRSACRRQSKRNQSRTI